MDPTLKSRLLQAKQTLNEWYDALNAAWKEAEDILISINLARNVVVHLYDEDPGEFGPYFPDRDKVLDPNSIKSDGWSHYLAFTNRGAEPWHICYVSVPTDLEWDNPYAGEWKPILECSAQIRMEAAAYLPKLLLAVVEEAEKLGSDVEGAVGLLKEAVAPFKAK